MRFRYAIAGSALLALALASGPVVTTARAQAKKTKAAPAPAAAQPQKTDEEYTKLIKEYLQGSAHHHRTGGSHARVRHRALAAEVPRAAFPARPAS